MEAAHLSPREIARIETESRREDARIGLMELARRLRPLAKAKAS